MSVLALVLVPALVALLMRLPAARAHATLILVAVALIAVVLTCVEVLAPSSATLLGGHVHLDASSRLFLAFVNPIFLGISGYVWSRVAATPELEEHIGPFVSFSLLLLAATNAVLIANHLLVMWIALEVTTLAAAPLIVRAGHPATRVASWRYLLFSSVGLGLVLLGFVCLSRSIEESGETPTFFLDRLESLRAATAGLWGKLGLSLVLLGLGTKLGLAPMYSWLPEAYDEAPPSVTALLGAVQFNAAMLVLFRVVHLFRPVHPGLIMYELVTLGLVSMVISTFSIIATRNMKRLVAYASINHAGVIAIGLGIGRAASYGLLLYVISNAFIKTVLFLTAGKIKAHYGTKDTRKIGGLLQYLPYSGIFLMVGTFALLGFPPFGSFFGELLILSALVSSGHLFVFAAFCVLITMTFVATGRTIFPMIWGEPAQAPSWPKQTMVSVAPKIFFLAALVVLGVYIPSFANDLIQQVANSLEAP
jgi:hydrogenase-4 component F